MPVNKPVNFEWLQLQIEVSLLLTSCQIASGNQARSKSSLIFLVIPDPWDLNKTGFICVLRYEVNFRVRGPSSVFSCLPLLFWYWLLRFSVWMCYCCLPEQTAFLPVFAWRRGMYKRTGAAFILFIAEETQTSC